MGKIKQGTGDQRKGRQTGRGGEFAKHHIVHPEVQRRDDNPKRDGFGDRPLNRAAGASAALMSLRTGNGPLAPPAARSLS